MLLDDCELIDRLWGLKEESYTYIMNILANLVVDKESKKIIAKYAQRIFLGLKYEQYDK